MNIRDGDSLQMSTRSEDHPLITSKNDSKDRLDKITKIIKNYYKVPIAFISLINKDEISIVSGQGEISNQQLNKLRYRIQKIISSEIKESDSRLVESIKNDSVLYVPNNTTSTVNNIDYYLSFILYSSANKIIGTLSIKDNIRRAFAIEDKNTFMDFGFLVESELNNISQPKRNVDEKQNISVNYEEFLEVYDSYKKIKEQTDILLKDHGINYREWRVLNSIIRTENSIPKEISNHSHLSKSLVSRYLNSLEAKGLIERNYSSDMDKRYVFVECTKDGENLWSFGVNNIINVLQNFYVNRLAKTRT